MPTQYHILNGDCLKEQFPASLSGELIVLRECLVDGIVDGNNVEELLATRATFMSQHYEGVTTAGYYKRILPEIQKIVNIHPDSEVMLWFEEDLFCQVNFWFTIHLLQQHIPNTPIYLIRPNPPNQYSFGYLSEEELVGLYQEKQLLQKKEALASLWTYYQKKETAHMLKVAEFLVTDYPFLVPAVQAHIDRIPKENYIGRPSELLLEIMEELGTKEFVPVFRSFNQKAAIYGFGDLQVKRLWENLLDT